MIDDCRAGVVSCPVFLARGSEIRVSRADEFGRSFIDDVEVGDIWNFEAGIPPSIQGLENGVEFLLVFSDPDFSEDIFRASLPGPIAEVERKVPAGKVPSISTKRIRRSQTSVEL